jgi:PKD repeat protein
VGEKVTLSTPSVNGMTVTINGGTLPTTQGAIVTRIGWNWGDGQSTTGWFPQQHTFAAAGTYQVTVTATDSNGQNGSASTSVTIAVQTPPLTPPR